MNSAIYIPPCCAAPAALCYGVGNHPVWITTSNAGAVFINAYNVSEVGHIFSAPYPSVRRQGQLLAIQTKAGIWRRIVGGTSQNPNVPLHGIGSFNAFESTRTKPCSPTNQGEEDCVTQSTMSTIPMMALQTKSLGAGNSISIPRRSTNHFALSYSS